MRTGRSFESIRNQIAQALRELDYRVVEAENADVVSHSPINLTTCSWPMSVFPA
jgi:hypothetical protein